MEGQNGGRHSSSSSGTGTEPNRKEVLAQLERVVQSVHFRNSKRYPALLRFVVEQTLDGNADHLKERTLGVEVFGRKPNYDTNSDPVVRFTAGEIRKRIAQYYLTPEHEHELRFELPLGSYVPHFNQPPASGSAPADKDTVSGNPETLPSEPTDALHTGLAGVPAMIPEVTAPSYTLPTQGQGQIRPRSIRPWKPKTLLLVSSLVLLLAGCVLGWTVLKHRQKEIGRSAFWQPLLKSEDACLIVIGVHSLDAAGNDRSPAGDSRREPDASPSMLSTMLRSEMVPMSDVVSYGHLIALLAQNHRTCGTRSAFATAFDQLRTQPLILLGGFDNIWTIRLTDHLRFHFAQGEGPAHAIVDRQNPRAQWAFDSSQKSSSNSVDYGIVTEFFDPEIEQTVLVVAGIGKDGTEAAAEFATDANALANWSASQAHTRHRNFEVVLSTQIIEGEHGPAHIVDSYSW